MKVDDKQRYLMITEAAYFLAERRNFESGHEHEDWMAAERQVDEMLKAMAQQPATARTAEAKSKTTRKAAAPIAKAPTQAKAATRGRKKVESGSAGNIPSEAMPQLSSAANDQLAAPAKAVTKRTQRKKTPTETATPMPLAAAGQEESKPATRSRQKKTEAKTTTKGDGRCRSRTSTVA